MDFHSAARSSRDDIAFVLGLLAVVLFALTLPATRLAVEGGMSPVFVAAARAVIAGCLAVGWLLRARSDWPRRVHVGRLGLGALGIVFGFPLFSALALRHSTAAHGAVVIGALPLVTAALGALRARTRPAPAFWACACVGALVTIAFAVRDLEAALSWSDLWWLCALASSAVGYVVGAELARALGAGSALAWMLVLSLPLTLPLAIWHRPDPGIDSTSWVALTYLGVVSMWLAFLLWYRALAIGGTVRISQVQLLQPVFTIAIAPLVGPEAFSVSAVVVAAALGGIVLVSRRTLAPE